MSSQVTKIDGRRPYHHGNLRSELLAVAEQTVREQGVERLSLRELARATGVSHAAPRRHFPDRQALLDALAESGFERLEGELRAALAAAGPDFPARLAATATAYTQFATADAALLDVMFAGKHRELEGPIHDASERTFSVMFELIRQGQDEGALEPGEVEQAGLFLFATLQGLAALINGGMITPEGLDELVADATAHFLRGAKPTRA
jgi:AcrR family transcriptional regulator